MDDRLVPYPHPVHDATERTLTASQTRTREPDMAEQKGGCLKFGALGCLGLGRGGTGQIQI